MFQNGISFAYTLFVLVKLIEVIQKLHNCNSFKECYNDGLVYIYLEYSK
jgi:hypothetical protein